MSKTTTDDTYTEQETARRMNEALKRALNTPHKPQAASEERESG